ncbi:unnamed protein product, partial [marine sediment metagenome]
MYFSVVPVWATVVSNIAFALAELQMKHRYGEVIIQ